MPQLGCLKEEELSAYQLGELPLEQEEAAAVHLQDCPRCAAALAKLDGLTDGVIAALRQFPPSVRAEDCRPPILPAGANGLLDTSPLMETIAAEPELPRALAGYELLGEIGRGGMGVVYKARQVRLNRIVALKMVLAGCHARHADLTRFLVEAEMVGRLNHPNIVQIHEVSTHDGRPFIALEYVSGGTLADKLNGQPWPVRTAALLLEQLARATDHAHRHGIVHRDLKPANILLTGDGIPKVADFGLAKLVEAGTGLTTTGAVLGTPAYMAPEQAEGDSSRVGPCSDVFALGVILYELLAGRPPFRGATPMDVLLNVATSEPAPLSRVQPKLPRDLCTICQHCLEKDPRRRYASAGALADDVGRFLRGEPIHARPVGELERAWKWARRRPAVAALLLAVAFMLLGWAGTSTYLWVAARNSESTAKKNADDAEQAAGKARTAEDEAVRARQNAESSLGRMRFGKGVDVAQAGQIDRGLHLMLQALGSAPNDLEFQRVVRASMAAYAERLPVLRDIPVKACPRAFFLDSDGTSFVTVTPKNELQRWDTQTIRKVGEPGRPLGGEVREVSRDGRWAIIVREVNKKQEFFLVDTTMNQDALALGELFDSYSYAGFAPSGDVLWITREYSYDGTTKNPSRLFDVRTGKPIGPSFNHDVRLYRARGRTIQMSFPRPHDVDADAPATFKFLDSAAHPPLPSWEPDLSGGSTTVQFDGQSIVTLGRDGLIRWWSPTTGKQTEPPWRPGRVSRGEPSALLAGGRTLLMLRTDGRLGWFDLASRQELPISLPAPQRCHLAVRPDGTAVLLCSERHPLRLWRVESLPPPAVTAESDPKFYKVAISPNGELVYKGTAGICKFPYGVLTRSATNQPVVFVPSPATYAPVFSQDGTLLATVSPAIQGQAIAQIRDVSSGQLIFEVQTSELIHSTALAPDARTLAVGYFEGLCLGFRDAGKARDLAQTAPVSELLFSNDGRWLASGSRKGWADAQPCFRVWEVTRKPKPRVRAVGKAQPTSDAPRFAFTPDSKILLTLELDSGILRRWVLGKTLKEVSRSTLGNENEAIHAVFSKDGQRLLTGYRDGRARQWDTQTGKAVGDTMFHPASVAMLAFSPNRDLMAIGCDDGSVWLRDTVTGMVIGPPTIHRSTIRGLAFSSDGKTLLSTSADGRTGIRRVGEPLKQSLEILDDLLRTATGTRLDKEGVVLLDANEWKASRRRLAEVSPQTVAEFARPTDLRRWHADQVEESKADGIGYQFHLDRLIELTSTPTSTNWINRARRGHLHARASRQQEAEVEYKNIEAVARESLLVWYQQCVAEARYDGDWSLALWYLDRLIRARPEDAELQEQRAAVRAALRRSKK